MPAGGGWPPACWRRPSRRCGGGRRGRSGRCGAPPVMQAALDAGATDLGENRAQELLAKAPELKSRPTWHFIGRLQRNKVASLAPLVDLWQSVDRLELGQAIAGRAPGAAVLAEVNVADDPAKAGVAPDDAPALVDG